MTTKLKLTGLAAFTSLITGCAGFQPIEQKQTQIAHVDIAGPITVSGSNSQWPVENWWAAYGDAQLTPLVQHGLANSPTLAVAQARITRAQAAAEFGRATNLPQINAGVDVSYGRQSENYLMPRPPLGKGGQYVSQGQAAVNFSADLDLWGRNAALIRSAEAQLKAAQFDRDAAQLALTTSICALMRSLPANTTCKTFCSPRCGSDRKFGS